MQVQQLHRQQLQFLFGFLKNLVPKRHRRREILLCQ
jgi:hypothetical protein